MNNKIKILSTSNVILFENSDENCDKKSSPPWGWAYNYTVCCSTPKCDGCTFTQGYYKNHYDGNIRKSQNIPWPISENTILCGLTWFNILHTVPAGNVWFILAHQYVAARLNQANGACVAALGNGDNLTEAGTLLSSNCGSNPKGNNKNPYTILSTLLDDFNNGVIGPGHCGDSLEDTCSCRSTHSGDTLSVEVDGKESHFSLNNDGSKKRVAQTSMLCQVPAGVSTQITLPNGTKILVTDSQPVVIPIGQTNIIVSGNGNLFCSFNSASNIVLSFFYLCFFVLLSLF